MRPGQKKVIHWGLFIQTELLKGFFLTQLLKEFVVLILRNIFYRIYLTCFGFVRIFFTSRSAHCKRNFKCCGFVRSYLTCVFDY